MNVMQNTLSTPQEPDLGYGQILAIVLRRRFWLFSVMVGAIGAALVVTLLQKPEYESSMQLLIEPNYQSRRDPGEQRRPQDDFADTNIQIDSATQINLMRSSTLLRKAMTLLQPEYPSFDPSDKDSVDKFRKSLAIGQVVEDSGANKKVDTKIFRVIYLDKDPVKTQKVLQTIRKVYLDYNLEQQRLRLRKGLDFIDQQLPEVRKEVRQAEDDLEVFRRQQGLVDPEVQAKALVDSLSKVEQEQQTTRAQVEDFRSRYAALQEQINLSPRAALTSSRLSQSARYQSLLNEFQKTELALVQKRLNFKDKTPQVDQLVDQRQRQLDLLRAEVDRVLQENSVSVPGGGEQLLSQGQLGELDVRLVEQYVNADSSLRAAQARSQSLTAAEGKIRQELQRLPNLLAEYNRLEPEVQLKRDTLKQLLQASQELGLEFARGGFDWQTVEEPQLGTKTGPSLPRNLLLGAVLGLLLGGLAAFIREAIDDAVHSSDELKKQVPIPLLGVVPEMTIPDPNRPVLSLPFRSPHRLNPETIDVIQWQPIRESLDLLCKNIELLGAETPLKSLVVTSALAGEGKSTIALGLALSAARLHHRVLLVDADLRRPSLHKLLDLPNDQGLSTLLASDAAIPTQLTHTSTSRSNISIVTAGPTPTDAVKLLSSQRLQEVMAAFKQNYDLVIVDAPPILGMADTTLIASQCQGVVMVGRIEQVTRTELNQAIAMLSRLNVIGMVANGAQRSTRRYADYRSQPVLDT